MLKMANHVIALTEAEAVFYKRNGIEKVSTIREAISIPKMPSLKEISTFERKHNLKTDNKILLVVSRIA